MTRIAGAIAPSIGAMVAGGAMGAGGSLALPLAVFALAYAIGGAGAFCLPIESRDAARADSLD
jgi:hypothetical protein